MKDFVKKSKRGISLVEVIVAIVVITIISVSATTVILSSSKNDQTNLRTTQIALTSKSVVDCFRFADDLEEFCNTLKKVDDFNTDNATITLNKETFSLTIEADFTERKVTITALDNKGKELTKVQYSKG